MRVLVTRAGSGAASNLIASLRRGHHLDTVIGCHDDLFVLKKSSADRNYLIAPITDEGFLASLNRVLSRERIRLVVPVTDGDVFTLSQHRREISTTVFLPRHATISLCQDKYALARHLRQHGVPVPQTHAVTGLGSLAKVFAKLPPGRPAWCRIRKGAGSFGAAPVADAGQARSWIQLWTSTRGVPPNAFTLAEYLPGRDFACQSLWRDGHLVLIKTTERLAYFAGGSQPSGTSSVAALHKTVRDDRVVNVSVAAVKAVDVRADGAFSIDLRENQSGEPCVTEINCGRLLSGTTIFDVTGRHNMAVTYVNLGLGRKVRIADTYDVEEGCYMSRDLDTSPHVFKGQDLWRGLFDARKSTQGGIHGGATASGQGLGRRNQAKGKRSTDYNRRLA